MLRSCYELDAFWHHARPAHAWIVPCNSYMGVPYLGHFVAFFRPATETQSRLGPLRLRLILIAVILRLRLNLIWAVLRLSLNLIEPR